MRTEKTLRSVRLILFGLVFASLSSCAFKPLERRLTPAGAENSSPRKDRPGALVIIQGPTSETESLINVMAPRLKNYTYVVTDSKGTQETLKVKESIKYAPAFYKVDQLHLKNLRPGLNYKLSVIDEKTKGKVVIDERTFSSLDLQRPRLKFATLCCTSDEWKFEDVMNTMWEKLRVEKPDLLVLNGDLVYVDRPDFIEKGRAADSDLWQRYIDTFRRIPLYHFERLIPILAAWDDHDYGIDNGDRDFASKDAARRIFQAFFASSDLPGVFERGPSGNYAVFTGFQQRLYLMDDRSFREPNSNKNSENFGHWGETQHKWLISGLTTHADPSWIFNGNQFFSGKHVAFMEGFEANHPRHFAHFLKDLKGLKTPVAFSSGDVGYSEVLKIPKDRVGYETWEVTSSTMHFHHRGGKDNDLRIPETKVSDFNFVMVQSENHEGNLKVDARTVSYEGEEAFKVHFEVKTPQDEGFTK